MQGLLIKIVHERNDHEFLNVDSYNLCCTLDFAVRRAVWKSVDSGRGKLEITGNWVIKIRDEKFNNGNLPRR